MVGRKAGNKKLKRLCFLHSLCFVHTLQEGLEILTSELKGKGKAPL